MQPTFADILAIPVVRAGRPELVGGGSLDRPVRWVHVSDLPDLSNLLQGGELVLTTGQSLAADPARYLRLLAEAGAAGLIVELGANIKSVPVEVAQLADELGLPVVLLHKVIRFVEVTEEVHRTIVARQYSEVAFARHAHEIFTGLSMKRASLKEILEAAAQIVGGSLVLEDLNRQVISFAAVNISPAKLLADWERRSRLRSQSHGATQVDLESWSTTLVGQHRQEWGRLVAPNPLAISEDRVRMVLERAGQALALGRMVERDQSALEQQAQRGLIDELRSGRIDDEAEATARANALGLQISRGYLPITIRVDESATVDQVVAQRQRVQMLDAVRHAVRTKRQTALTAGAGSRLDVLLALPAGSVQPEIIELVCTEIRTSLARSPGVNACAIGVGVETSRLLDAALGLEESAHVAEVALALPGDQRAFYRSVDVRLRGLLGLISEDPRVQAFAEAELRGLLDHRARHGGEHMKILRTYLEMNGNKSEVSKHLHISRPALYSKLETIQRILGLDIENAESRTSLHTALLILESRSRNSGGVEWW